MNENLQIHRGPALRVIFKISVRSSFAGATEIFAGFGADHHLHGSGTLALSAGLPVIVEFIETAARVHELLPQVAELAEGTLIALQDTTIYQPAQAGRVQRRP